MTVHLIKLCVGADNLHDLADWQARRNDIIHPTRHTPKRADEVLDGGSLYWVIKGFIVARQKIIELREVQKNNAPGCGIVLDKTIVNVQMRPRRPFQGWRYLEAKDAPKDITGNGIGELPDKMQRELAELGLL